jgi:polysaccharide export outer membrane protein
MTKPNRPLVAFLTASGCFALGCSTANTQPAPAAPEEIRSSSEYAIGPGDTLQIFVWQNPDISVTVPVRPDGKISTPLVNDIVAVGKSPTQLSLDIETALSQYVRDPEVNVIVTEFVGTFDNQIRVVGQATNPRALSYREQMTLLDVMIEVGGLTEFASGNRAKIVRTTNGVQREIPIKLKDLLNKGEIEENMLMQPGDVLIIPESRF